ncbi:MAG: CtkA family protein [Clostridium sp.]|nr:CtkA family protein [Clostridium sp.]
MQKIIDFSTCETSIRHGLYGGRAGDKDGIRYHDCFYIIKYPKPSRYFQNLKELDYVTSPLSEYIGSHIYAILGYDVHETLLGYRNNKIVVACKDFCGHPAVKLMEMRTIKNGANKELESMLEQQMKSSATGDNVDLDEQLLHLEYNPTLQQVDNVKERFWDMAVIDILIDNKDRNNGNWGLLLNEMTGMRQLAPIYDNGNAFSSKATDAQLKQYMDSPDLTERLTGSRTIYMRNGKTLSAKKLLKLDNQDLKQAIVRNTPKIQECMPEIKKFIQEIPETYQDKTVCSSIRKQYYGKGMEIRLNELLLPAYEAINENKKAR